VIAVSTVVVALAVVAAAVAIAFVVVALRRPKRDQGVESFRRHIDALSPEAREEMKKHVRPPEERP
jgi:hypothetical protein